MQWCLDMFKIKLIHLLTSGSGCVVHEWDHGSDAEVVARIAEVCVDACVAKGSVKGGGLLGMTHTSCGHGVRIGVGSARK